MKEIPSKNRKIDENDPTVLCKKCSILVLNKLPGKLKDNGSFFIPCLIRSVSIDRALCDHGLSVTLMPYFICKILHLRGLRCTNICLQLEDLFVSYPFGILEDVLIKVDDFYVHVDFMILDMTED